MHGGAHYPGDFWRACILCTHPGIPQNFENKSLGKYISKALFERLFFGEAYIRRGLSTEGNLRCKIDWASLIVRSKCTIFALFYCVFEGNFPSKSLQGTYFEGRFKGGFFAFVCVCVWGGGIFREAPTWRGLFSEFYGNIKL